MLLMLFSLVGCGSSVKNEELDEALSTTDYDPAQIKNLDPTPQDNKLTLQDWRFIQSNHNDELQRLLGVLEKNKSPLLYDIRLSLRSENSPQSEETKPEVHVWENYGIMGE